MSEREEIRERKEKQIRERVEDSDGETAADATAETPDKPVHISGPEHMDEFVGEHGVVLADFYADWCGPCKMIEPVVEEIAAETDAAVAKVDVDAQQRLARQYQVQGVPTLYLFSDGEPVEQIVGLKQKPELVSLVEQYA
ncbi:MAG: thioredoxin [Haloarculaceae archaeon]